MTHFAVLQEVRCKIAHIMRTMLMNAPFRHMYSSISSVIRLCTEKPGINIVKIKRRLASIKGSLDVMVGEINMGETDQRYL